jgi:hypothetical protein
MASFSVDRCKIFTSTASLEALSPSFLSPLRPLLPQPPRPDTGLSSYNRGEGSIRRRFALGAVMRAVCMDTCCLGASLSAACLAAMSWETLV